MRERVGWILLAGGTVACIFGIVLAVRGKRMAGGPSAVTVLVVAVGLGLVFLGRWALREK